MNLRTQRSATGLLVALGLMGLSLTDAAHAQPAPPPPAPAPAPPAASEPPPPPAPAEPAAPAAPAPPAEASAPPPAAGSGDPATPVESSSAADAANAPAAADNTALSSVVVTAQRRETNLQQTPIAISAFGPRDLETRGATSVRDLAGQIPNLFISRTTLSHTTQTYSLRGIGESDPIQEPVVAVYIDDVYQPRQLSSNFDFNDVLRVEVLRGPQGTLYGRNSSAGAIRVITADPGDEFRASAGISYGSFNAVKTQAAVTVPLIKNRLSASVAFLRNRRDGTVFNETLKIDTNRIDVDAARLKLRWTPSAKWDIQTTANGMIDRSDSRGYVPAVQPGGELRKDRTFSEVPPYQRLNQGSVSVRAIYHATDNLDLKSISALGGFNLNPVWYDNDGQADLVQKNLIHYADGYFTQEIQANGHYERLSFSTGAFYLHERFYVQRDGFSRRNAMNTDPAANPENYSALRAHNVTTTDSIAFYGEANLKVTDWATLTGGLRETIEAKSFRFDNKVLDLDGNVVGQSIKDEASNTWSALTPKASISLQYAPSTLHYFSYSRGFKSGGFDNRATSLQFAKQPFNPEFVNSFETGLKNEFFNRHLRANLAAFYNDYRDLQVSYTDPAYPGTSIRGNAGKAHTLGVELETSARLPFGLGLNFSGGYLHAVYDSYKNAGGNGVNADGNPLVNSPKWNVSYGASYDLPIPIPGLVRLAADVQWASEFYNSALKRPQDRVPDQTFVNGTLSWTSPTDRYNIILSSRNILDTQRRVTSQYTPGTGVRYYNFPDPRTVMITFKYNL